MKCTIHYSVWFHYVGVTTGKMCWLSTHGKYSFFMFKNLYLKFSTNIAENKCEFFILVNYSFFSAKLTHNEWTVCCVTHSNIPKKKSTIFQNFENSPYPKNKIIIYSKTTEDKNCRNKISAFITNKDNAIFTYYKYKGLSL